MKRRMRIRRDYSNLHFSDSARRGNRLLIVLWALTLLLVGLVFWQFDRIQPRVLAMIAPPQPTP